MIQTNKFQKIQLGLFLLAALVLLVALTALSGSQVSANADVQYLPVNEKPVEINEVSAVPLAANVPVDLCASDGTIVLPDSTVVSVWGFVDTSGGPCTTGLVNSLPGPEIRVNAGDTVTINLTNALSENVSILIPGQDMTAAGGVSGFFTNEAAASGGTVQYSFTAVEGTYLYESGTNVSIQIPMGLYGALIVQSGVAGQAYGHNFDTEAVLLLSEIDPNLNANPSGFDLLTYHPTYWLINGKAYPDTDNIIANPGDEILLRYLNAGFDHLSMSLLGAYHEVVAKDGFALPNSFDAVAEIIPAGMTADMFVDTTGIAGGLLPLYNRNMYVTNAAAFPGGMFTYIEVQAPVGFSPTIDVVSPAQGSTLFGDLVAIEIDASDAEDAAGTLTVEWNVDGGAWMGAAWDGTYYTAVLDTTVLGDGAHTINARAADSDANISQDSNGVDVSNSPSASLVSPASGATIFGSAVAVQIDASDAEDAAGTLIVEWNVDGGAWMGAAWDGTYYTALLDSTGYSDGAHNINVRATDSRALTGSDTGGVDVSNSPSASLVSPASGATIFGDSVAIQIDASDAEDAAGTLTVEWNVDGGAWMGAAWDGTYYTAVLDSTGYGDGAYTINVQATDSTALTGGDSGGVTVSNQPSVNIVAPAEGGTFVGIVTVQIDANDAEDAAGSLTVMWNVDGGADQPAVYNGGTGYYEATWDTSLSGGGAHTINASVMDSRSNTAFDSNNVTVGSNSIHIGDLDGTSAAAGGPNWTATLVVTVHAADESPVAGVTVTFEATRVRSSNGSLVTSTLSCVTNAAGQCTVTQSVNSNQFENTVSITITGVTGPAPYLSGDNHDPDLDSDGTTIEIAGP